MLITAAKRRIEKGEPLTPTLFCKNGKGVAVYSLAISESETLQKTLHKIVQEQNPDEYAYLSEAFIKMFDDNEEDTPMRKLAEEGVLQVSQFPSAKDAIITLYGDRTSEKIGIILFENKDGSTIFEPITWADATDSNLTGGCTGLRNPL